MSVSDEDIGLNGFIAASDCVWAHQNKFNPPQSRCADKKNYIYISTAAATVCFFFYFSNKGDRQNGIFQGAHTNFDPDILPLQRDPVVGGSRLIGSLPYRYW